MFRPLDCWSEGCALNSQGPRAAIAVFVYVAFFGPLPVGSRVAVTWLTLCACPNFLTCRSLWRNKEFLFAVMYMWPIRAASYVLFHHKLVERLCQIHHRWLIFLDFSARSLGFHVTARYWMSFGMRPDVIQTRSVGFSCIMGLLGALSSITGVAVTDITHDVHRVPPFWGAINGSVTNSPSLMIILQFSS